MSPRTILLAVSASRYSAHLVEHAIEEAKLLRDDLKASEEALLHLLYITEGVQFERVSQMVGDEGFLGIEAQEQLLETLAREHSRMARRRVREIEKAAKEIDFAVKVSRVRGNFVDKVLQYAKKTNAEVILITGADRPFLARMLFGSDADRVARLAERDGLGEVIIDRED